MTQKNCSVLIECRRKEDMRDARLFGSAIQAPNLRNDPATAIALFSLLPHDGKRTKT